MDANHNGEEEEFSNDCNLINEVLYLIEYWIWIQLRLKIFRKTKNKIVIILSYLYLKSKECTVEWWRLFIINILRAISTKSFSLLQFSSVSSQKDSDLISKWWFKRTDIRVPHSACSATADNNSRRWLQTAGACRCCMRCLVSQLMLNKIKIKLYFSPLLSFGDN